MLGMRWTCEPEVLRMHDSQSVVLQREVSADPLAFPHIRLQSEETN